MNSSVKNMAAAVTAFIMSVSVAAAASPAGVTVKGVTFQPQLVRGGRTLSLNGAGVRTRVIFKVYAAALYVGTPSKEAGALLSAAQPKLMELVFLRSVDGQAVSEAITKGFEKNSKDKLNSLSSRLGKFRGLIPDFKKGDRISFVSAQGEGVAVEVNGSAKGKVEGDDFAEALFRCWLGDVPADPLLKKGLIGQ
jgi:hypothetical protein